MRRLADIQITDKRGHRGDVSLSKTVANLRARGFSLPNSPPMARQAASDVKTAVANRTLTDSMRHTGSNVQMALPKVREPMSSFKDKGIPFDTTKPKELREIRKWARLFYSTHDLIPLMIDIYSKFPLVGMEFTSKDPKIKEFYESMYLDNLDYDTFLQDVGREYFISGEVNTLGHFDETLGIWSAEEVLNPDTISVSKSMFVQRERVQLLVKDLVEVLRSGTETGGEDGPTRSEQLEKRWEYEQLVQNYPEILQAAANDDGLDIADALISRIVNKVQPWDLRGTPHLLRSFRTLLMEESLNAAQDAVADRLYSPFILATLGIANLGDNEPWIPDQGDLDACRDDMQNALAADFRLMVHNFGLDIKSVFGREAVPRFDSDYSRVDKKLMQAWGIGEALISGGTGNTYASSALNREFVTQIMVTFQKAIKRHMRKRSEVIAEAQGHYDYEMSGSIRKPIFREIVETDPETGEEYTRKVPKLLIPEVKFQSLNLRDEAQERSFLQALRSQGVPISDMSLAVNIPIEFEDELEKQSEEKVKKLIAEAQAMQAAFHACSAQGLPIPPDIARYYAAGAQLTKEVADAGIEKDKGDVLKDTGTIPGEEPATNIVAPGVPGVPGSPSGGGAPSGNGFGGGPPGGPADNGTPDSKGMDSKGGDLGVDLDNGIANDQLDNSKPDVPGAPPINVPVDGEGSNDDNVLPFKPKLPQRNRTRPEESDEMRKHSPRKGSFGQGPSSYGSSERVSEREIESALKRLSSPVQTVRDLVENDEFFVSLNRQSYTDQIRADIDSIYPNLEIRGDGSAVLTMTKRAASDGTDESFTVLCEMIEQHEEVYGFRPEW